MASLNANVSLNINQSSSEAPEGVAACNWAALFMLVIVFFTVTGNLLVILAVSIEKKLRNPTNFFLRSLAVADVLVGVLVMPAALVSILHDHIWPLPDPFCSLWIFLDVLFSTASIMHLCAISLDRYISIRNPMRHGLSSSLSKTLIKISVVWGVSTVLSVPIPVLGFLDKEKILKNGTCGLNEPRFVFVGSIVAFFIPLVIMVVCYYLTIHGLKHHRMSFPQHNSTDSAAEETRTVTLNSKLFSNRLLVRNPQGQALQGMRQSIKNEQRASKVLGIVFSLFLVMWCPFFVINVLNVVLPEHSSKHLGGLQNVFVWVGYISSGVNPLIYTLFNKTYRQAFARYLRCRYHQETAQKTHMPAIKVKVNSGVIDI